MTQAADALPAALKAFGIREHIAIVTPYFPIAETHLQEFVGAIGYRLVGTRHPAPVPQILCEFPQQVIVLKGSEITQRRELR